MMDSLSTELIAQTVVMNAILFWYWISETAKKKIKKEKKVTKN